MKRAVLSLSVLFVMALSLLWGANPQLTPEERPILETSPGVVLVLVSYKVQLKIPRREADPAVLEFSLSPMGTGFVYRPDGYIITNAHVVADANVKDQQAQEARSERILKYVLGAVQEKIGRTLTEAEKRYVAAHTAASTPQIRVILPNKATYVGEIKAYSDPTGVNTGKDVAILKIDANNLPTVKLGNSDEVRTGDPLMVIGYPGAVSPLGGFEMISMESALVPSVTSGHVSAVKTDYKGTPVIQSDAAITHGNSGGPAFNVKSEAVGIATYGNDREVAGFNFFVPINTAMEFVRQAGATPEQGAFDKAWAGALDAFQAENWETAKGLLADSLTLMPNEPDALRLQTIAAQQARAEGQFARATEAMGVMRWPAIGLAAVLAIGLLAFLTMRSRPQPIPVAVTPAHAPSVPLEVRVPSPQARTKVLPPETLPSQFGTLYVTAGSLTGNRFPITKAGLLIGRDSAKCQIVISDDTISKEHAWVVPVDHEVVVIDRGSSNGTYVNSTDSPRVNKVTLKNGDRVYIGQKGAAVLTYHSS